MPGTKGKGQAEKADEILCKEGDVWKKKKSEIEGSGERQDFF